MLLRYDEIATKIGAILKNFRKGLRLLSQEPFRLVPYYAPEVWGGQCKELLGSRVHARFGDEFPIRFDFLDTMGGQNLSLQVHPLTE